MDVSTVIRKAQRRFGDTSGVLLSSNDWWDFINDAQLQIVRLTGDLLFTVSGPAASTFPLNFPSDMIRGERCTYSGQALSLITKDDLDARQIDETLYRDSPNFYYYYAGQVHLYPDPPVGDTQTATFTYWSMPTEVILNSTPLSVPVAYHEDIVTFCVARAHERNENWAQYERTMAEFNNALSSRKEEATIKDDTYQIIRDDPWDDYVL